MFRIRQIPFNVFIKANLILVRMQFVYIDLFTLLIIALQFVRDITMLFWPTHGAKVAVNDAALSVQKH